MSDLDAKVRTAMEQQRKDTRRDVDNAHKAHAVAVRQTAEHLERALSHELGADLVRQMGIQFRPIAGGGTTDLAAYFSYGGAEWRLTPKRGLFNTLDWKIEQRREGDPAAPWHPNVDGLGGEIPGLQGHLKGYLLPFMGEVAARNRA